MREKMESPRTIRHAGIARSFGETPPTTKVFSIHCNSFSREISIQNTACSPITPCTCTFGPPKFQQICTQKHGVKLMLAVHPGNSGWSSIGKSGNSSERASAAGDLRCNRFGCSSSLPSRNLEFDAAVKLDRQHPIKPMLVGWWRSLTAN